jgi:hypothetical protein
MVPYSTNLTSVDSDSDLDGSSIHTRKLEKWCRERQGYPSDFVHRYTLLMFGCWNTEELRRPDFEGIHITLSQMYDHMLDD